MRIVPYNASDFLSIDFIERMTSDVGILFNSYVHSHIKLLEKADPDSANLNYNYLLTVEDGVGKIWGFRYFYCEKEMQQFHFFAVAMDKEIRRQGYAMKTFKNAVEIANKLGYFKFLFTINSQVSEERDGLVNAYKRMCTELNKRGNRFIVNYYDNSEFKGFELN